MASDERVDVGTGQVSKKNARQKVLDTKAWTATPNWFEIFLRAAPASCSQLLWYILRNTVGYSSGTETLEMSLADLEEVTKLSRPTLSRWLTTLDLLCFIRYLPARNGANSSKITIFPKGVPTEDQVMVAVSGMASATRSEQKHGKRGHTIPSQKFATLAREWAIHWRLQWSKPEEHEEIKSRSLHRDFV